MLQIAGVLCSAAFISNALLLIKDDASSNRNALCTVLVLSRIFIMYFFLILLFFCFVFRSFLILYSDRGLVKNGRPNLELFTQIFWVVTGAFIVLCFAFRPGTNIIRGNSPIHSLNKARACLLGNLEDHSSKIHSKNKGIAVTFGAIILIRLVLDRLKLKRFIFRLCPNGRMSCMGKFRRNVIDLNQTYWGIVWHVVAGLMCCVSVDYGQGFLSVKTQFWIWNLSEFISYEGAHFILPFLLKIPDQGVCQSSEADFYVRKPVLVPRRELNVSKLINPHCFKKGSKKCSALTAHELGEFSGTSRDSKDIHRGSKVPSLPDVY